MSSFCTFCGSQIADGAATCLACGKVLGQSPNAGTALPEKHAPDEMKAPHLARLGDRLLATILDTLLLVAMFAVIGMWSAVRWGGVTPSGFSIEGTAALITFSLVGAAGFLYYWILEAVAGATLGKAIVGIQVRMKDGGRCSFTAALLRNVLRIVDGIAVYLVGFLIAVFSKLRQRLGDHVAGTVVVERQIGRVARIAVLVLFLAGIVGGISEAYLLHRGAPVSAASDDSSSSGSPSSTSGSTIAAPSSQTPVLTSGNFKLMNVTWTEGEDGPPRSTASYKPGNDVYAKYDLIGFTTDPSGQMDVALNLTAFDPNGLALDKAWTANLRQASDTPIHGHFHVQLPKSSPGGTCKVVLKARDALKNSDAEFTLTFSVEAGPPILPATQLEIRNFRYSTSEDGPLINPAVYHPGQSQYSSFDVFGVQFRDDRTTFHIAYKLLGPDGQVLLDVPDYHNTDQTIVYHPATFFVRLNFQLDVPSDAPKGTFTEQLVVTDKQANTTLDYVAKFEVR
jgi:uncharacterized RDD family membrane protein YckC